jgi:hypothetical protein
MIWLWLLIIYLYLNGLWWMYVITCYEPVYTKLGTHCRWCEVCVVIIWPLTLVVGLIGLAFTLLPMARRRARVQLAAVPDPEQDPLRNRREEYPER